MLDPNKVKIGDKVKVNSTKTTIDGTLYKDSIVKIDEINIKDGKLRVVNDLGKIWYIDFCDIDSI